MNAADTERGKRLSSDADVSVRVSTSPRGPVLVLARTKPNSIAVDSDIPGENRGFDELGEIAAGPDTTTAESSAMSAAIAAAGRVVYIDDIDSETIIDILFAHSTVVVI